MVSNIYIGMSSVAVYRKGVVTDGLKFDKLDKWQGIRAASTCHVRKIKFMSYLKSFLVFAIGS